MYNECITCLVKQHPYLSAPRRRHPGVDPASNNKNTSRKKALQSLKSHSQISVSSSLLILFQSEELLVNLECICLRCFTLVHFDHKSKCIVSPEVDNYFPVLSMTQFCSPARGDDHSHKLMWHMQAFDFPRCYCV